MILNDPLRLDGDNQETMMSLTDDWSLSVVKSVTGNGAREKKEHLNELYSLETFNKVK